MRQKFCRGCKGENLEFRLNLGLLYPSTFISIDDDNEYEKSQLILVECKDCHLVQLLYNVDLDSMYRMYWYQSSLNSSMVVALRDIVKNIEKRVKLNDNDIVIDIGCNDCTLFTQYSNKNLYKIGFDPAYNLKNIAEKRSDLFVNDYFSRDHLKNPEKIKAKAITAIAMFYDLPDPTSFLQEVKSLLSPEGIFVIQLTDFFSMQTSNAFDNICHEHLEYYSLEVLWKLFLKVGLEIFDMEYNLINGGSIRIYASLPGQFKVSDKLIKSLSLEYKYSLTKQGSKEYFKEKIDEIKDKVSTFLFKEKASGKKIYGFGASTKGNTFLQVLMLDSDTIEKIAEINPDKYGLKTIGTNIPIVPQADAMKENPDYFLVLPWHFINTFIEKNKDYLDKGGAFIVPMPLPSIITKDGWRRL